MSQEVILEQFEEEEITEEVSEDSDEAPWETAFEEGVKLADDEMVSEWDEEDEFT